MISQADEGFMNTIELHMCDFTHRELHLRANDQVLYVSKLYRMPPYFSSVVAEIYNTFPLLPDISKTPSPVRLLQY